MCAIVCVCCGVYRWRGLRDRIPREVLWRGSRDKDRVRRDALLAHANDDDYEG